MISVGFIGDIFPRSLVVHVAITACPSVEPEISVGFIGDYVTQYLVEYVAITACPSQNVRSRWVLLEFTFLNL